MIADLETSWGSRPAGLRPGVGVGSERSATPASPVAARALAFPPAAAAILSAIASILPLVAAPAAAQPYARFAVPESALVEVVRGSGADFEPAWNALLVAELRASMARADSAVRLLELARRVARAEPGALGNRIAADALRLRSRWTPGQRRLRVGAAVAESLGGAAQAARRFARADSLFGSALRVYQRLGERRRAAWVWGSLGSVAFLRGDMAAADSLNRQALAARRAIGDSSLVGRALNTLGSIAFSLRRHDEAWRYYQEARAVRVQTGERAALGTTLSYLGNVAAALGHADSARVYYQAALDLTVAQGDSARAQEVLHNYAVLLMNGADPAAAFPLFERALAIRRQRGDLGGQAQALSNIGNLLRQQGHFAEALQRLGEAHQAALAARDARTLRQTLVALGRVGIGLGDAAARAPLERALELGDSLGDHGGRAEALNNLSIVARLEGDPSGAERLATRALAAAEQAGDSLLIHDAAATLGELAFDRGELERAGTWFSRAASAGTREASQRAGDLQNLGVVAARASDGTAVPEPPDHDHRGGSAWPTSPRPCSSPTAGLATAGLAPGGAAARPLNLGVVTPNDSFLVMSHGFEDLLGNCRSRGWTGQDLDPSATVEPTANDIFASLTERLRDQIPSLLEVPPDGCWQLSEVRGRLIDDRGRGGWTGCGNGISSQREDDDEWQHDRGSPFSARVARSVALPFQRPALALSPGSPACRGGTRGLIHHVKVPRAP